jgi:type IV secretory pathway TraG/TraD family ATPase VirD4
MRQTYREIRAAAESGWDFSSRWFAVSRTLVTIAGARAGKTSTVLEPNLSLYPGSCVVLDPKGELTARTAQLRHALGHNVYVLDPFGRSGIASSSFNALAELDLGKPSKHSGPRRSETQRGGREACDALARPERLLVSGVGSRPR